MARGRRDGRGHGDRRARRRRPCRRRGGHTLSAALLLDPPREPRWGEARLSDKAVALIVKRAVSALPGRDPRDFAGHSLRAGFVTSAAMAGKKDRRIMDQTRHTSHASFRGYIREAEMFIENAAEGLL